MNRILSALVCFVAFFDAHAQSADAASNPSTQPTVRPDQMPSHNLYLERAIQGDIEVLFLGDSSIEGWREAGKPVWLERFRGMKAANFGIAGDRVENVLWRVENGVFTNCQPRVIVLLVGAGNARLLTKDQVAEGISVLTRKILELSPQSKILLLGLFPRGETNADPRRAKASEINSLLAKLDDGRQIFFLDIGQNFLQPDGTISRDVMPDFGSLSAAGYKIWADGMQGKLTELLN